MTLSLELTLVGNIGAPATAVVPDVDVSGHSPDVPQAWPLGQQPPPIEAGQEKKPEVQVSDAWVVVDPAEMTMV